MSNPDPKPSGLIQVRDDNLRLLWLTTKMSVSCESVCVL